MARLFTSNGERHHCCERGRLEDRLLLQARVAKSALPRAGKRALRSARAHIDEHKHAAEEAGVCKERLRLSFKELQTA